MSQKWILALRLLCATLIMACICCTITSWIHPDLTSNLRCLYVCLPICICTLLIRKTDSLLLFLGASILMAAVTFLMAAEGAERVLFTGCTIVICVTFLCYRAKQTECILLQPHVAVLGLFFGMNLIGSTQHFPVLCLLAHYFTIAFLLILLVYSNLTNFQDFAQKNFQSANLPFDRICGINRLLLTVNTVVTALILFAMPVSGSDGLLSLFKKLLVFLVRPILAFLRNLGKEELPPMETEAPDFESPAMLLPGVEDSASSPIWQILSEILVIVCILCAITGLICVIRLFIKNYHRELTKDADTVEFLNRNVKATAIRQKPSEDTLPRRSHNPNLQIRRQYKKQILNNQPTADGTSAASAKRTWQTGFRNLFGSSPVELPKASHTPTQLEADSGISDAFLHKLYEQARYSRQGCTSDDVQTYHTHATHK